MAKEIVMKMRKPKEKCPRLDPNLQRFKSIQRPVLSHQFLLQRMRVMRRRHKMLNKARRLMQELLLILLLRKEIKKMNKLGIPNKRRRKRKKPKKRIK